MRDAEYVRGYTSWHLHQRIDEHHHSPIGKHLKNVHGLKTIGDLSSNVSVLKKCRKLDWPIYEMLFIKEKKPSLNTQSDSIRAKLFVSHIFIFFIYTYKHVTFVLYFVTLKRKSVLSFIFVT